MVADLIHLKNYTDKDFDDTPDAPDKSYNTPDAPDKHDDTTAADDTYSVDTAHTHLNWIDHIPWHLLLHLMTIYCSIWAMPPLFNYTILLMLWMILQY